MARSATNPARLGLSMRVAPETRYEEVRDALAVDGSGDWEVRDRGKVEFRAPLGAFRVSVLWKADVYRDEAEQRRKHEASLSLEDVARVFNDDLAARNAKFRFDVERLEDPALAAGVAEVYPEARPIDALPSIYDR